MLGYCVRLSNKSIWEEINKEKWILLGLAGFFLTWYFIVRIVFFAIYYKSLDFEVLNYYQPFLFTPYIIAFSLIAISLAIAKTSKYYLQLDRILALIFWDCKSSFLNSKQRVFVHVLF